MAREYKDSGIEWIGQIPKEWEMTRGKFLFSVLNGYAFDSSLFTNDTNMMPLIRIRDINSHETEAYYMGEYPSDYIVHKDEVLVGMDGDFNVAKWKGNDALLNQRVCKLKDFSETYISQYAYYLLPMLLKNKNDVTYATTVKHLSSNDILNFDFIVPSPSEQQKIADYLDKVCGEVDEMVDLQETIIEELKAYKQSVITEAVTKGLNPNVPMRDSGIDWIGEIPDHWGTPAISYLAKITSGSTPDRNNPLFWGEGTVNWIKTGELQNNRLSCSEEKVTEYALNNTSIKLYPKDTILMAMYGQGKTRGMTALLDVPCTTNQACAALSIFNKNVDVLFLWKCLMGAYDAIRDKAVGTGQPNLNIDLISKFVIPLPPYNEQVEIVAFIDEITPQIDSLIALKRAKIEELKEYKKSVIYEYVTGKKEVV